jgi:hypothetical protein
MMMVINQEVWDIGQFEDIGNVYKILIGMCEVKEPLESNLEMELRKYLIY